MKYFRDISRTCPFTLTNVTATLPSPTHHFFFFFLMDCPFLPPPAQIASAGQLNKIKQTNGIPQSLSPLTVESWCKHQWKTVPHEYTELPSATTKSSGNNAANPEPQNNHLPTLWPEEKQVAYKPPIIEAFRYVYKSNPVVELVLAGVIDHSARRGYRPSPAWVISRTGASPVGY